MPLSRTNEQEIEHEPPFDGLTGYTYSHKAGNIGDTLSLDFVRVIDRSTDGKPTLPADTIFSLNLFGMVKGYRALDSSVGQKTINTSAVTLENDLVFISCTKEIQFMSVTERQYGDLAEYYSKFGTGTMRTNKLLMLKLMAWDYSVMPVNMVGGWWAYIPGTNRAADSVLGYLGACLGVESVYVNLPPYRIRQVNVPRGTTIFDTIVSLVSAFDPLVYYRDGVLFIAEKTSTAYAGQTFGFTRVENATDTLPYKEHYTDLVVSGGVGPIHPLWYDGDCRLDAAVTSYSILPLQVSPPGGISIRSYGPVLQEYSSEETTDPRFGNVKVETKLSASAQDPFLAEKYTFYQHKESWEKWLVDDALHQISAETTHTRFTENHIALGGVRSESPPVIFPYPVSSSTIDISPDTVTVARQIPFDPAQVEEAEAPGLEWTQTSAPTGYELYDLFLRGYWTPKDQPQPWCEFTRRGGVGWILNNPITALVSNDAPSVLDPLFTLSTITDSTKTFTRGFIPDLEWEFWTRTYDYRGRLVEEVKRVTSAVYTTYMLSPNTLLGKELAGTTDVSLIVRKQLEAIANQRIPFFRWNALGADKPVTGTLFPLIAWNSRINNWVNNYAIHPVCTTEFVRKTYRPMDAQRYTLAEYRRVLEQDGLWREYTTRSIIQSENVPARPITPKEATITMRRRVNFNEPAGLVDRPEKHVSVGEAVCAWDFPAIYDALSRRYLSHNANDPHIVRSVTVPAAMYFPPGSRIRFREIQNFERNTLFPQYESIGYVDGFTISKNVQSAKTSVTMISLGGKPQ